MTRILSKPGTRCVQPKHDHIALIFIEMAPHYFSVVVMDDYSIGYYIDKQTEALGYDKPFFTDKEKVMLSSWIKEKVLDKE